MAKNITITISEELHELIKNETEDIGTIQNDFILMLILLGLKTYIKALPEDHSRP